MQYTALFMGAPIESLLEHVPDGSGARTLDRVTDPATGKAHLPGHYIEIDLEHDDEEQLLKDCANIAAAAGGTFAGAYPTEREFEQHKRAVHQG